MLSVTAIVLLTLVVQTHAKEQATNHIDDKQASTRRLADDMVDKLLDRGLHVTHLQNADMDGTTVGKPAHSASARAAPTNLVALPPKVGTKLGASSNPSVVMAPKPATQVDTRSFLERNPISRKALTAMIPVFMVLGGASESEAARSGGRVGGGGGFAKARANSVAPKAVAPSVTQKTTNVYVQQATPMYGAPMMGGGMGYGGMGYGGMGMGYGGFGGGITTGEFLGIELINAIFREQERQRRLQRELQVQQQLGADQAKIQDLQNQLAQVNSKMDGLKQQAPPGTKFDDDSMRKMQEQMLAQQKEIEMLKAEKAR